MIESEPSTISGSSSRISQPTNSSEQGRAKNSRTTIAKWATLLAFLPFLLQAVVQLKLLVQCIFVRNDASYPEGVTIYALLTSFHTHKLYSPPFDFPWNAQMYGPLLYVIGAFFANIAHGEPTLTTVMMRMLSFVLLLGSGAIVSYLAWKLERQKRWAAVVLILGFASAWVVPHAAVARADVPSIFLVLAAVAVYERAEGRSWLFFWAGVLGSLSCLTKQNTAAVLVALLIDSLIARKFRQAVVFVAGGVIVLVLVLGSLELRHEPFMANFTVVGHAILDWSSVGSTAASYLNTNQIAVIPICIAVLGAALCWRKQQYRVILLVIFFGVFSNVAALANTGGASNYLILPWFLLLLLVPAGLMQMEQWAENSLWIPGAILVLGSLLLIHQKNLLTKQPPPDLDARILTHLDVLSDEPYLELRSQQPQLLDPYFYNQLVRQKQWSDAPILQRVDGEVYDLVLLTGKDGSSDHEFLVEGFRGTSYWRAEVLNEMALHYRVLCDEADHLALVPRGRSESLRSEDIEGIFHKPCRSSDRRPQVLPGSL